MKDYEQKLCDFILDVAKHIDKKNHLERGDKDAWGKWFDRLEMFSNLSEPMVDKFKEHVDNGDN